MKRATRSSTALHRCVLAIVATLTLVLSTWTLATPFAGSASAQEGPTCDGLAATIVGDPDDDVIVGTSGSDVIVGTSGDDIIRGLQGDDVICAGAGNDIVRGDHGNDRIFGGEGVDRLFGGSKRDHLMGGPGRDWLWGQGHRDNLDGGPGPDRLNGGPSSDRLIGGPGRDILTGSLGDWAILGGPAIDVCRVAGVSGCPGDDARVAVQDITTTKLSPTVTAIRFTSNVCGYADVAWRSEAPAYTYSGATNDRSKGECSTNYRLELGNASNPLQPGQVYEARVRVTDEDGRSRVVLTRFRTNPVNFTASTTNLSPTSTRFNLVTNSCGFWNLTVTELETNQTDTYATTASTGSCRSTGSVVLGESTSALRPGSLYRVAYRFAVPGTPAQPQKYLHFVTSPGTNGGELTTEVTTEDGDTFPIFWTIVVSDNGNNTCNFRASTTAYYRLGVDWQPTFVFALNNDRAVFIASHVVDGGDIGAGGTTASTTIPCEPGEEVEVEAVQALVSQPTVPNEPLTVEITDQTPATAS